MTYNLYGLPLCLTLVFALNSCGPIPAPAGDVPANLSAQKTPPAPESSNPDPRAIAHYICYDSDTASDLRIWIGFSQDGKAQQVKYKGQVEAMDLSFDKEELEKGGAYPTITTYYTEIYEGRNNGSYKLTHSGIWDYAQYIRGRDSKLFDFTIDHNAEPYGKTPCF